MTILQIMGKIRRIVPAIFILLSPSAYAQGINQANYIKNNPDGSQMLLNHVPKDVALGLSSKMSHVASTQMLDLRVILPSKDQAGLDNFIKSLHDPKSPNYHKFLTPAQFALLYGASSTDSAIVIQQLKSRGLVVKSQSNNGCILTVSGQVSTVEPAFKVNINNYKRKDGTTFFAPDSNPTIPPQIAGKISAIVGMDNALRFRPHNLFKKPLTVAKPPKTTSPAFTGYGGSVGPNDIATAYNYGSLTSTGTGQTLGLYELDGYVRTDVATFESYYTLPNVSLSNVITDGFNGSAGSNSEEDVLDIDLAAAVAPGLSNILVYEAPNTGPGWIDQWNKIATDNVAKVISCSWGLDEADAYPTYDHTVFSQLAAQGQTVFVSSGDAGAYDNCDGGTLPPTCQINGAPGTGLLSVDDPASDPYVTGVGISILTSNLDGTYKSETSSLYSGGGISAYWSIPSFQQGLTLAPGSLVSTSMRNVPDVSFNADQATPYGIYISSAGSPGWYSLWGSSAASPIWAAFLTRVNQGRVAGGSSVIGYLDPIIYQILQVGNYVNDFHDITTGNNSYYPAKAGYDDATGLGSFNGLNLYNDLVLAAPTGLIALGASGEILLSWGTSSGAVSYNVKRATINGGPYTTISSSGSVTGTSYVDNSVVNGTTYYYVVSSVNALEESPNSAQVSAIPHVVPLSPSNLKLTILGAKVGNTIITAGPYLVWTQSASSGIIQNKIYRAAGSGAYSLLSAVGPSTTYTDKSTIKGTTYKYEVTAVNSTGESLPSNMGQISY